MFGLFEHLDVRLAFELVYFKWVQVWTSRCSTQLDSFVSLIPTAGSFRFHTQIPLYVWSLWTSSSANSPLQINSKSQSSNWARKADPFCASPRSCHATTHLQFRSNSVIQMVATLELKDTDLKGHGGDLNSMSTIPSAISWRNQDQN